MINSSKKILLTAINDWTLSHEQSYITNFWKNREKYIKNSGTYSAKNMWKAIKDGINYFINNNLIEVSNIKVIEIWPGVWDKLEYIINALWKNSIKEYSLRDISSYLINLSNRELNRLLNDSTKINIKIIDVYTKNKFKNRNIKNSLKWKYLFIPNNSTLFTNKNWDRNKFTNSKWIFITLDLYNDNVFSWHIWASKLCLHPLELIGIPYIDYILEWWKSNKNILFTHTYNEKDCTSNIRFDLWNYIELLKSSWIALANNIYNKYRNVHKLCILSSLKFQSEKDALEYFNVLWFNVSSKITEIDDWWIIHKYISLFLSKNYKWKKHY